MIKIENLKKRYPSPDGDIKVLNGINLIVDKGESIVITGDSGSGKTTLLNLVAGLDTPTEGKVYYFGENIFSFGPQKRAFFRNRKIGMIFQFFNLLKEFSTVENVAMPLIIGGEQKKSALKKAKELLVNFGMGERLEHKAYQLSGGEQQRVSIARALINDPELLLLDEPTGNLDWKRAKEIIDFIITKVEEFNLTNMLVTHSLELASLFPKRYHLKKGTLEHIK